MTNDASNLMLLLVMVLKLVKITQAALFDHMKTSYANLVQQDLQRDFIEKGPLKPTK